jgi:hypothetical protein
MGKIVAGVVGGLGRESNARDPWLFAKIPALWFFGIEIPRVFVLGLAVVWFGGAMKLIADGFGGVTSVHAFETKLRAGKGVAQLLQEDVQGMTWSNQMCELAAQAIIRGRPYSAAIKAIAQRTGNTVDDVVLSYKLTVDFLSGRCALIKRAVLKVGSNCTVPDFSFPAVRVKESQKRSLADRLTKVDISSTGNLTPLLTQGDLIYSYDDKLIWSAEQLDQLAGVGGARDKVRVGVLRRVKTTNHHPLMGVADEYAWQALRFEIAGGPIGAGYETQGSQPQELLPATPGMAPEAMDPDFIRFTCPGCGKRLKSAAETVGKGIRCPKCQLSIRVPAEGS